MPDSPAYPRHWEADIVARDGATMHVRPIVPGDAEGLQALHLGQSEQSRFFRFFGYRGALSDQELGRFTSVDHHERVALVVTEGVDGPLSAMGCYDAVDHSTAEVAFYVADSQQGRGLGSVLLDHLAAAGRERGYTRFVAEVLPTNRKMLSVFREAGYSISAGLEDGIVEVSFDLTTTEESWRVMTAREQHAESRSMRDLMTPEFVVAVASGRSGALLDLLAPGERHAWAGALPPEATGRRVLAVVAVDDAALVATLADLGRAGVRAAVVISGRDSTDPVWHADALAAARGDGMRIVGPGSYGLLTPAGDNLTFVPELMGGGVIGVFAQGERSSAALIDRLVRRGVPVSSLISAGHRIDVSGNDAMQWFGSDGTTRVVALALDSIGNPRKFARIARHLARTCTVVCHIGSTTGQAAPPGHVVRTSPLPRAVLSDMLRQAGVIEAVDHDELITIAQVAARLPEGAGRRIAVAATTAPARAFVRRAALERGLIPLDDDAGDGAVTGIAVDLPLAGDAREPAAWEQPGAVGPPWALAITDREECGGALAGVAVLDDAGRALDVVARLAGRGPRDDSPLVAEDDVSPARVSALIATLAGRRRLDPDAAAQLLGHYGVAVVPVVRVATLAEALVEASRLGYPLAVKAADAVLRHRMDLGGVHLDVHDEADLAHAVRQVQSLGVLGVELQRMVANGPACVLAAEEDPLYGPVVSFGLAGDAVEILDDVAYRITPLSRRDVTGLVHAPKASVRLSGYRGLRAFDTRALEELVGRVSLLKDDFPSIRRIELNPVVVSHEGAHPLGVVVELLPAPRADGPRRTLPTLGVE